MIVCSRTIGRKAMSSRAICHWAISNGSMRIGIVAGLLSASTAAPVYAEPNDYMRTPVVEYGEREIDFKSGQQYNRDGRSESANSIGFGFTPTSWWFTELYTKYAKPPGETNGFDAWEWENRVQLTETGQYPVDTGFLLEIERPKNRDEGYQFTYGPMFQSEWGKIQGNFNVFLQKNIKAAESLEAELHYQVQLKYRDSEKLEWGTQAFGNLGRWDHWNAASERELKIGPALFGKVRLGIKKAVTWNTAILVGTTNATPNYTLRLQAEYEF